VKNKVAPPFCEAEFDIIYNHGIDKEGSILDMGIDCGAVDKKGAWLQFEGDLIGQGKDAARRALIEKPDLAKKIVAAIMLKRNPEPVAKSDKPEKAAEKAEKAEK
jgi:recombination protein RecA